MSVNLTTAMNSATLGSGNGTPLEFATAATSEEALSSLGAIDSALRDIASKRADLGAVQNELASQQRTLAQSRVSHAESKSRIADTDVAKTTAQLARDQILMKSSSAVIAQANQISAMALSLVG
jgi:flagellin